MAGRGGLCVTSVCARELVRVFGARESQQDGAVVQEIQLNNTLGLRWEMMGNKQLGS